MSDYHSNFKEFLQFLAETSENDGDGDKGKPYQKYLSPNSLIDEFSLIDQGENNEGGLATFSSSINQVSSIIMRDDAEFINSNIVNYEELGLKTTSLDYQSITRSQFHQNKFVSHNQSNETEESTPFTLPEIVVGRSFFANPTPITNGLFGSTSNISGDYAIIGGQVGFAYIYNITNGDLLHTLTNPNPPGTDFFGEWVSIDGNYAVVSASQDDTGASNAGSIHVFDVTTGNLLYSINNPDPQASDGFGRSAGINGDYIIAGALFDDTGATDAGSAYIFDVATGNLLHILNNPDPQASDSFGNAAISENYVIVGANRDDTGASDTGSAYVYDVITGDLLYTLNNPLLGCQDRFGFSVDIDENNIIVSAARHNASVGDPNVAFIFDVATGNLLHTLNNPDPTSLDFFGWSTTISKSYAAVSANQNMVEGVTSAGSVYVYDVNTGDLVFKINNPDTGNIVRFGDSVTIEGNHLLIGAPFSDVGATRSGATFTYRGDFDDVGAVAGTTDDDYFLLFGQDEIIIGGGGADLFLFNAQGSGHSIINDFDVADNDVIDISHVLQGYDPMTDLLSDFVRIRDSGGDAILEVDADGGADNFVDLITIIGNAGLDAGVLETNGHLDTVV